MANIEFPDILKVPALYDQGYRGLHDMYSIHGLRLMLDKMAESGSGDLDSIVKDLRRLHERMMNN